MVCFRRNLSYFWKTFLELNRTTSIKIVLSFQVVCTAHSTLYVFNLLSAQVSNRHGRYFVSRLYFSNISN